MTANEEWWGISRRMRDSLCDLERGSWARVRESEGILYWSAQIIRSLWKKWHPLCPYSVARWAWNKYKNPHTNCQLTNNWLLYRNINIQKLYTIIFFFYLPFSIYQVFFQTHLFLLFCITYFNIFLLFWYILQLVYILIGNSWNRW